jgi:hypothetical protein
MRGLSVRTGKFSDMTKRKTLEARTPEDLLAVVPIVLGFHPEDSIVMLTFGGPGETFHARVDLPTPDEVPDAVSPLLQAAVRNDVARVAFILYTDDAELAAHAAAALTGEFGDSGFDVVTVLRADGRHWFRLEGAAELEGRPYDVGSHRFAVQSVYEGAVTHRNRAAMAASLAALPESVPRVTDVLPAALGRLPELDKMAEATWVVGTVFDVVTDDRPLSDEEVARLVVAITDRRLRDVAWLQMHRAAAGRHVALWTDVLRRTPEELVAAPACLLAFAAWLAGQGALAWCAVDRCRQAEPDYSLAEHIALMLDQAIAPSAWDELGPECVRAADPA